MALPGTNRLHKVLWETAGIRNPELKLPDKKILNFNTKYIYTMLLDNRGCRVIVISLDKKEKSLKVITNFKHLDINSVQSSLTVETMGSSAFAGIQPKKGQRDKKFMTFYT